jgi:hypothetical protein
LVAHMDEALKAPPKTARGALRDTLTAWATAHGVELA